MNKSKCIFYKLTKNIMEKIRENETEKIMVTKWYQIKFIWYWWHNNNQKAKIIEVNWVSNYYFTSQKEAEEYKKQKWLDSLYEIIAIYIEDKNISKMIKITKKTQQVITENINFVNKIIN